MSEGKVVAIIQGRMSSSRLPGKVLLPIGDRSMLDRVIGRVARAKTISKIIVATSGDPSDDPIEAHCADLGVACFRGSLHDVLDRFYQACSPLSPDLVVRVTADCPFIDPDLIDQAVHIALDGSYDFVANRLPPPYQRTYPIGLDVEVCKFSALENAWRNAKETYFREHVMPYLYETVDLTIQPSGLRVGTSKFGFSVAVLDHLKNFGDARWTVDTREDLEFANAVAAGYDLSNTNWLDLKQYLDTKPEVTALNAEVRHKTLKEVDHRAEDPILTLFTSPKPFIDPHISLIQRNAILSWIKIPRVKIILLGDEIGLAEFAALHGLTHIKEIARGTSGAPMMDDMFRLTRETSNTEYYCVINADIILFPDFVDRLRKIQNLPERFVIFGQRYDIGVTQPIAFEDGWEAAFRQKLLENGALHRPAGSDYFLYPKACYQNMPAFVIGRAGWDNWMIYHARKEGFAAIDASAAITIAHQNHDYAHLPDSKPHYDHPETRINIDRAGGRIVTRFTIMDADKRWVGNKIINNRWRPRSLWRWFESYPYLKWDNSKLSNRLWRLGKILRIYK